MGDITKLKVWDISLELATIIYRISQKGEISKDFSFRDQLRRAAVSVPSNIAEGLESGSERLGLRYFYIAKGSLAEIKTQLLLAVKIGYIREKQTEDLLTTIELTDKMLNKLISYRKKCIREHQ